MIKTPYSFSRLPCFLRFALVPVVCVVLSGCQQKELSELKSYVANVKQRPAKPIEPVPTIKPYLRFIYSKHGIDPFDMSALAPSAPLILSPIRHKEERRVLDPGVKIDKGRVPEYLERYPLEALKFVGTVNQQAQRWALIRVPDGGIQRVKKGNYMGKSHGRITKVDENSIQLKELTPNGFGGYKERDTQMQLRLD